MHIFIDESGDTGIFGSPTQYFAIACIIFNNKENMQRIQAKVEEFKEKNNIKGEIHFCETPDNVRDNFFHFMLDFLRNNFLKVRVIVTNKQKLYSEFLRHNPNMLYNFLLKNLLNSLNTDTKEEIKIVIDKKGSKKLEKELSKYIKGNTKFENIKEIRSKDSKKDILLQVADMFVSCIGHSYNKTSKDKDKWKNIVKDSIFIIDYC